VSRESRKERTQRTSPCEGERARCRTSLKDRSEVVSVLTCFAPLAKERGHNEEEPIDLPWNSSTVASDPGSERTQRYPGAEGEGADIIFCGKGRKSAGKEEEKGDEAASATSTGFSATQGP
jgi:hypothetical protein